MLLRCFSPPVAKAPFARPRPVFQPFVPPAAALVRRVVFTALSSVPDCCDWAAVLLLQQFTEFFAAKLVMVPSLPCRDLAGYGEIESVFKLIDSKDKSASLQGRSPSLMFRNLMTQVEGGCKPEVFVNAFRPRRHHGWSCPRPQKGGAR